MRSIIWVRNAVSVLKIKPAREIGRQKYFNPSTLGVLSEHLEKMSDRRRSNINE